MRLLAGGGNAPCDAAFATVNCNASRATATGGGVAVELLGGNEKGPIPGFSGSDAARLQPGTDGVALSLVFGGGTRALPLPVETEGVRFRVTMYDGNIQFLGITLRCK